MYNPLKKAHTSSSASHRQPRQHKSLFPVKMDRKQRKAMKELEKTCAAIDKCNAQIDLTYNS